MRGEKARPQHLPPDGSIDAGLLVLEAVRPPGRTYSAEEIAHVYCRPRLERIKRRRRATRRGVRRSILKLWLRGLTTCAARSA